MWPLPGYTCDPFESNMWVRAIVPHWRVQSLTQYLQAHCVYWFVHPRARVHTPRERESQRWILTLSPPHLARRRDFNRSSSAVYAASNSIDLLLFSSPSSLFPNTFDVARRVWNFNSGVLSLNTSRPSISPLRCCSDTSWMPPFSSPLESWARWPFIIPDHARLLKFLIPREQN